MNAAAPTLSAPSGAGAGIRQLGSPHSRRAAFAASAGFARRPFIVA
jgi:hypothetical protein